VSSRWRPLLEQAAAEDRWVELRWANEDGTTSMAVVRVLMVGRGSVYLVRRADRRMTVPLKLIVSARLGDRVVIRGESLEQDAGD